MEDPTSNTLSTLIIGSAVATVGFGAALTYALLSKKSSKDEMPPEAALSCDNSISEFEADKEMYPGGHLTIYYGSQTGTSESFANEMQREGETHGFKIRVVDMEDAGDEGVDIQKELLNENYNDDNGRTRALFLMATYGEGESTDNAMNFVNWIQQKSGVKGVASTITLMEEERDDACLSSLDYAVFGLGNTQYEHFNAMGKLVDAALVQTGAQRITNLVLGDDDVDLESDFEKWREVNIWPALKKRYISSSDSDVISSRSSVQKPLDLPPCDFVAKYLDGVTSDTITPNPVSDKNINSSTKHYFTALDCPVTATKELRSPEDPGSTAHVEIDISKVDIAYNTADNLAVLPVNDASVVESVASVLSYDLDAVFELESNSDKELNHLFPTPCTIRECLARYVDLTSSPRRSELKQIAQFATDPLDKQALLRMSSKEGKAEYREKILGAKIGFFDIITKFCKSVNSIPLERLIQICPHLQPRYYTIASSSSVHPSSVHLTVSVLQDERKDGTLFKGVCSNYLSHEKGSVRVFCRDSTFRLPEDVSKPIIMIGPGTGVAPMRALLQERAHMKRDLNLPVGPNILYFGCKKRKLDYIYQSEIESFQKSGDIEKLRLAFSRDQSHKVYVQNLLKEDAKYIWDLVGKEGAYIYVCGGTQMGHDVCATLKNIFVNTGDVEDDEAAKKYLENLQKSGRLVQELWS